MHQVPTTDDSGSTTSTGAPPPEPSHAERCRTLVASGTRGALSTLAADPAGYPYGSVASYGLDDRGNPLFFVSLMAEHTQNAIRDPRASLLVTEPVPDGADPLASGRVTLIGRLEPIDGADRVRIHGRRFHRRDDKRQHDDIGHDHRHVRRVFAYIDGVDDSSGSATTATSERDRRQQWIGVVCRRHVGAVDEHQRSHLVRFVLEWRQEGAKLHLHRERQCLSHRQRAVNERASN